MKTNYLKSYILIVFSIFYVHIHAQGALDYMLTVKSKRNLPEANLPIVLVEANTFHVKNYKTDVNGQLNIQLTEGKKWIMHVGEMKGYKTLLVPEYGGRGSATVVYDLERWRILNKPAVDRSKLMLTKIPQKGIPSDANPIRDHSIVEIHLQNSRGQNWRGANVSLVSYDLNTEYASITNTAGIARFHVPNNQHFQIDVDGEVDFDYIDVGSRSVVKQMSYLYEKIDFKEAQDDKGYIRQTFEETPKAVSNRVMVSLGVQGGPNSGIEEDVYIEMAYSNKKYYGKTDSEGNVIFLLPKKREYVVSFKYQTHADVIDLTEFRQGVGEKRQVIQYIPDDRLLHPENYLPSKDNVAQFDLNGFKSKTYPNNNDGNLINVHAVWGGKKINSDSKEAILELGFSVNEPINKAMTSKPLNISFVLDRSGSMSGENIDMLKTAMEKFVNKLRPQDKVSLVFFNDESALASKQALVNKPNLLNLLAALTAGGGTNIYDGLKMGYDQVSSTFEANSTNRVILLTDGYGSKPIDFILEQSDKYFKKGISVSTIGVGESYNNALLSLISKYSGGLEHQVIGSNAIDKALEAEFESLFFPLASELKVSVKYNNRIVYKTLYGIPEFKNSDSKVTFKLEKVFASMNKMALVKFKLNQPNSTIENEKIIIKVDYFDEMKAKDVSIEKEVALDWSDETDIEMIYDKQLKQVYSVAQINQCLKAIADLCDQKRFEDAKKNINQTLKAINKTTNGQYTNELLPLVESLKDYLEVLDYLLKNEK